MTPFYPPRDAELSAEGLLALGARTACDREPIHLSGAIQPHGFLVTVDPATLEITSASENLAEHVCGLHEALGRPVRDVLGPEVDTLLRTATPSANPHDDLARCVSLPRRGVHEFNDSWDLLLHRSGPSLVLEFELHRAGVDEAFHHKLRDATRRLLNDAGTAQICEHVAEEIHRLTGYDRVMVYRFEADAHGHVVAETKRDDLDSFLGLNYPASDIPRQARLLYLRNWIRVISDVAYEPVPIVAFEDAVPADQLDLSMSVLRSVSPMHLEYMRNMGVRATLTISLIVDGQLWGLIACHHSEPKCLSHSHRLACETLGQLTSVRLKSSEHAEIHERQRKLGIKGAQVLSAMATSEHPAKGAEAAGDALVQLGDADGVILEIDGRRIRYGDVPDAPIIEAMLPAIRAASTADGTPYATSSLAGLEGIGGDADLSGASGALYLPISGRHDGFVLWLRREHLHTVRWGNAEERRGDDGPAGADRPASPHRSFEEWSELVRGRSRDWDRGLIAAVMEFGEAMPEVVLQRSQNRLVRLALHDPLTSLPNRTLLEDKLSEVLDRQTVSGAPVAVMFVDLDGFKTVNDTQGHAAGDELLRLVGRRLNSLVRGRDIVARLGGDEFVVVAETIDERAAEHLAQRIVDAFSAGFVTDKLHAGSVTASVGVAMIEPGTEPAEALRRADSAMYHAKQSGRNRLAKYGDQAAPALDPAAAAQAALHEAIASGQIVPFYQPIFSTAGSEPVLTGFEALARWVHPTRGLLLPDEFIGLAEETGLINDLGACILVAALEQLRAWPDASLTMAVNVSVREIVRPGFAADVVAHLARLGISPDRLCLEVTESQMIGDPAAARDALATLSDVGVGIAIDDFGTGFSSMAYVRNLPTSELKIDRTFVQGLPAEKKDLAVATATVHLAKALGMRTVAEGVETAEQLSALRDLGADRVQGFFLGRPMSAEVVGARDWAVGNQESDERRAA
jgi:diguanylate cyclase (GGDEF)-like protein